MLLNTITHEYDVNKNQQLRAFTWYNSITILPINSFACYFLYTHITQSVHPLIITSMYVYRLYADYERIDCWPLMPESCIVV
jgi:hypothetical protein